jgi:NAD(P)-dependent dehydrogenase (short-subunit alcohol dehydrogenase family)
MFGPKEKSSMVESGKLAGQVALVTGAGGEIGSAIAQRFAREGASVAVADVVADKAKATTEAIVAAGGKAIAVTADIADPASAEAAVADTIRAFGKLTTLVNVAAAMVRAEGTVETVALSDWNTEIGTNVTGTFLMCKYAVPHLRRAGGATIINIASQLGHLGVSKRAAYCVSKAAIIHFTRILAMDHAADRIRVNSISPGFILTERSSAASGGKERAAKVMGPKHLLGRPGMPDEIAAGAVYLASDDSSFVTGTDLLIDGGYVAFKGEVSPDGTVVPLR